MPEDRLVTRNLAKNAAKWAYDQIYTFAKYARKYWAYVDLCAQG